MQEPWVPSLEHPKRAQGLHSPSLPLPAQVSAQTERRCTHTSIPDSFISHTSKLLLGGHLEKFWEGSVSFEL